MMRSDIEIKDDILQTHQKVPFWKKVVNGNFARHQKDHPTLTGGYSHINP